MIYVGIDVAKDKHDCFISNSHGEVYLMPFPSLTTAKVLMHFTRKSNP
jgi:transposase